MKTLFRLFGAKYMTTSHKGTRYFWSLKAAIAAVENNLNRDIVWTLDHQKAYTHKPTFTSTHPDAKNFNTQ
jgi:hypothetical protein